MSSAILAAACSAVPTDAAVRLPLPARDTAAFFQTDSLEYSLDSTAVGWQGSIRVLFTNQSSDSAFFVNCNGLTALSLEKLAGAEWTPAWFPALPLCLSLPIIVKPGGDHLFTISIFGAFPEMNAYPKFATAEIGGVYRIVFHQLLSSYRTSLPFGTEFPLERRISNQFRLSVAHH